VKVAAAYEAVVGARQRREAEILKARAFAAETNALAQSGAIVKVNDAEAWRNQRKPARSRGPLCSPTSCPPTLPHPRPMRNGPIFRP